VIVTVLSSDQRNDPAMAAAIGASAALSISDAPWDGPTACASVGFVDGQYVLNPTLEQLDDGASALELTVAATKDAVLMVEAAATELNEDQMVGAIEFAQRELAPVIALIERMREEIGLAKRDVHPGRRRERRRRRRHARRRERRRPAQTLRIAGKHERGDAIKALRDRLIAERVQDDRGRRRQRSASRPQGAFRKAMQAEMRRMVVEERVRVDGRDPTTIRPIWIETGVLPMAHGSAVFTRGETQVLGVRHARHRPRQPPHRRPRPREVRGVHAPLQLPALLDRRGEALRGVSRRELGHGNLARRALLPMMPSQDDFPYVIRVVGETLESNGSSSMATVCAGSLALMDAGVPMPRPVAGIAMGLVMEGDRYAVLSDILGDEDALGDMDFKVTGTSEGVTALQMDIKIKGITPAIMREALQQAKEGRMHILGVMAEACRPPLARALRARAPHRHRQDPEQQDRHGHRTRRQADPRARGARRQDRGAGGRHHPPLLRRRRRRRGGQGAHRAAHRQRRESARSTTASWPRWSTSARSSPSSPAPTGCCTSRSSPRSAWTGRGRAQGGRLGPRQGEHHRRPRQDRPGPPRARRPDPAAPPRRRPARRPRTARPRTAGPRPTRPRPARRPLR
jgi:polyribonucleotide nucleotidyltransferase